MLSFVTEVCLHFAILLCTCVHVMAQAAPESIPNDKYSSLAAKLKRNYNAMDPKSTPCVLVATGTFSPVHRMHVINMELAKQHIESQNPNYKVIGGFISPTHQSYCDRKLKNLAISAEHRLKMISLALDDHESHSHIGWIEVSPWHPNQARMQSIDAEIGYIADMIKDIWSEDDEYEQFLIFYVCGSDLGAFGFLHGFDPYGACILQRDSHRISDSKIDSNASPPVYLIEIPDQYNDIKNCSSTEIRKCVQSGTLINHLTFDKVQQYMVEHDILGAASLKELLSINEITNNNDNDDAVKLEEQKQNEIESTDKMVIALGSGSFIKYQVILETFGAENVEIKRLQFDSAVNEQPVGKEETLDGASFRAKKAQELEPNASMWIGIENGMYRKPPNNNDDNESKEEESVFHHWVDAGCIVIIYDDGNGKERIDVVWSDALPIPVESTKQCLTEDGKEAKDNGNHTWSPLKDPHRELTNGLKPRKVWLLEAMQKWKSETYDKRVQED